jgi:AraC-like DNA-binding protein
MSEIVRADALRGFCQLTNQLGGDGPALLREAGIDPASLADVDAYISFRRVIKVLEHAADVLNCPDFGMRFAQVSRDTLGAISVAITNAESPRQAIAIAQRYMHFHNPSVVLNVTREDAANDFVALELHMTRPPPAVQTKERGVLMMHNTLKLLGGANYKPKEVWFEHAPLSPLSAYRDMFGETPIFEKSRNGLIVPRSLLEAVQPSPNAQLRRIAEHYLASVAPPTPESDGIAARARTVIAQIMRSGHITQADLAKALGLHERTLQRRLKAEDTSFEALRDEARRDLAQTYLAQADVPLAHIAEMLGYAEASAFTRAARRWFGMSPRDMRKKLAG